MFSRRTFLKGSASAVGVALAAPAVHAAPRKVVFWHSYTQKARSDFMRAVADRFEAANPGVSVEIEVVPWGAFTQRWPAASAANALPDVAVANGRNAIPMAQAGVLNSTKAVLDDVGGDSAFTSGLIDNSCRFDGEYVSLPHYVHANITIFRKDRLEAANLSAPKTWDDTIEAAVAMTKAPDYYGDVLKLLKSDYAGAELLWDATRSAGGHFYDSDGNVTFDSDAVRQATGFLAEIGRKASGPGIANMGLADTFTLMNSGKQSMCHDSGAIVGVAVQQAPDVAEKLDATIMPTGTQLGSQTNLISLVLPKGQNSEDGQKFLSFLYAAENYMPFLTTIPLFMFPAYQKADMATFTSNPIIGAYPGIVKATLDSVSQSPMAGMDFGLNPFAAPVMSSGLVEDMLQRIILNDQPIDAEVSATAEKIDKILQDVRSRT